jgi:hypothetical protein
MKTTRRRMPLPAAKPDRSIDEINAIIARNSADPTKGTFEGLTSSEIALRNGRLMFGSNDEAFPSQEDWARIVD